MKKHILKKTDPEYELFILLHSGQITDMTERMKAKHALFHIHYGNVDYTDAMKEALEWKNKNS